MTPRLILLYAVLAAAFLCAPPILFPYVFSGGFFWNNKDAVFYLNALQLYREAVVYGEFLPRWLMDANAGVGSPLFYFYAPLSYLLTNLGTFWLAPFDASGKLSFLLGEYAAFVLSAIACYAWLKRHFSHRYAALGGALYMLMPYRWLYVYIHANLANLWALVWLPLWMIAADRLREGKTSGIPLYALMLALVALTHPPTLLAFGAIPLAYVLFMGHTCWKKRILSLAFANIAGLALAAFYLAPVYYNMPLMQNDNFMKDDFYYANNFFHIDTFLNIHYAFAAGLVLALWSRLQLPLSQRDQLCRFWIVILFILGFLTFSISAPIWEIVTPLQYLQFPATRLHAGALIAATFIFCYVIERLRRVNFPEGTLPYFLYSNAVLLAVIYIFAFFSMERLVNAYSEYTSYSPAVAQEISDMRYVQPEEYTPRTVDRDHLTRERLRTDYANRPLVTLAEGKGSVSSVTQTRKEIIFEGYITSKQASVIIRQWHFAHWRARDENGTPIALEAHKQDGLISLKLPAGKHRVILSQGALPGEKKGALISILSGLALLALMAHSLKRERALTRISTHKVHYAAN